MIVFGLFPVQSVNVEDKYLGSETLTYSTANPLTRRFEVKPGGRYHIIPTKYMAGEIGSFLLRVFSKKPLQITLVLVVICACNHGYVGIHFMCVICVVSMYVGLSVYALRPGFH